jgi:hypothetical protein
VALGLLLGYQHGRIAVFQVENGPASPGSYSASKEAFMWAPTYCAAFCLLFAPEATPDCPRAAADEPQWIEPQDRPDPNVADRVAKKLGRSGRSNGIAERSVDEKSPKWSSGPRPILAAEDLVVLWNDLTSFDDLAAGRAMGRLIAAPALTVPFLAERLPTAGPVDRAKVVRLVAELDDRDFTVREKAAQELEALGDEARVILSEMALSSVSPEVQYRVAQLLESLDSQELPSEELRMSRSIRVLEEIGTPEALTVLNRLALGEPGVRRTREAQTALLRRQ